MNFEELVEYAKQNKCSDIHITVGTNLAIRRYGTLEILKLFQPAPDQGMRKSYFLILLLWVKAPKSQVYRIYGLRGLFLR